MSYYQGFLLAVPEAKKDVYRKMAESVWHLFREYGAISTRECWGVDVPEGEVTSFPKAVKLEPGEAVVFSWIEWPDRATADACAAAMETDPRWQNPAPDIDPDVFDMKRMIWGGFEPIFSGG